MEDPLGYAWGNEKDSVTDLNKNLHEESMPKKKIINGGRRAATLQ
jgi:hypothetical protein